MPKRRVNRHSVHQPQNKSYRLIPLTQGQNAIVDVADFDWLSQWDWYAHWTPSTHSFYARRNVKNNDGTQRTERMHRLILGCTTPQEEGDHRNHDTLDNRRENLRKCSKAMNARNGRKRRHNTSGFKGVFWSKKNRNWNAAIHANKKLRHIGCYASAEEAAKAYDRCALKYHGQFAHLNFTH
jgi:hypothetical protein